MKTIEAVTATCETAGNNLYYQCLRCHKYFTDAEGTTETTVDAQTIAPKQHNWDYANAVFNWSGYGCANATVTCLNDTTHKLTVETTVSKVTDPATCTTDGSTVYTAKFTVDGNDYTDTKTEVLSAFDHNWGAPTYVWADDNLSVTATRICGNDENHVETETVAATAEVTTLATCTTAGKTTYTSAAFENNAFAVQSKVVDGIPAELQHNWDYAHAVFNWSGYGCANATVTCLNDTSHKLTVETTVSKVTDPATCTTDGSTVYTAKFTVDGNDYTDTKTEVLSAFDHNWGAPTYVWADDNLSVTATRICGNDENHVETETVAATAEVTTLATCTTAGKTTYTSAAFENNAFAVQSKVVEGIPSASDHNWDYAHAVFNWAGYGCANATVTCLNDTSHKLTVETTVSKVTDPATCTTDGSTVYTAKFTVDGNDYTDTKTEVLSAFDHNWGAPTYVWADDNLSVTATRICGNDENHVETETVAATAEVTTLATCTTAGKTTYTSAAFENNAFAVQTKVVEGIPAASDHNWDYSHAVFNWAGYGCANATVTCLKDENHKLTVTTEVTSSTQAATCTADGQTVYTAKFTVDGTTFTDTKTQTLGQTGHAYEFSGWTWADDYTAASANFTCANNNDHTTSAVASIDVSTVQAVCTTGGKVTYTATAIFEGRTYTDVKEVLIGANGHNWGAPVWTWSNDYSVATAKFTCSACQTVETLNATVTSVFTADTCLAAGKTVYTATVTHEGVEFTDSKTVNGTKLPHSYTGAVRDNNNGTHSFKCVNGCGQYGGTVDCTYGEWDIVTPVGCLTDGLKVKTCGVCGHQVEKVIPATGHPGTEIVNDVPATCTEDGYTGDRACTVCHEILVHGQPIPSNGKHVTGDKVIEPVNSTATCTANAYHYEVYYCKYCGAEVIRIQIVDKEATGHTDADGDGACDVCGASVETAAKTCNHLCHSKQPVAKLIWKIVRLFYKLFHINKYCECGEAHY